MVDTYVEFRPRPWRWVARQVLVIALLLCVGMAAVGILVATGLLHGDGGSRDWFFYTFFGLVLLMGVLGLRARAKGYARACAVRVSGTDVSGGSRSLWAVPDSRVTIALAELDQVGSARRTVIQRFTGRQYLRSTTGRTIRIERWTFDHDELHRMLALLGVEERDLA
jgi:hypothetical protein